MIFVASTTRQWVNTTRTTARDYQGAHVIYELKLKEAILLHWCIILQNMLQFGEERCDRCGPAINCIYQWAPSAWAASDTKALLKVALDTADDLKLD